jgi:hypothetical protein
LATPKHICYLASPRITNSLSHLILNRYPFFLSPRFPLFSPSPLSPINRFSPSPINSCDDLFLLLISVSLSFSLARPQTELSSSLHPYPLRSPLLALIEGRTPASLLLATPVSRLYHPLPVILAFPSTFPLGHRSTSQRIPLSRRPLLSNRKPLFLFSFFFLLP